MRFDSEPLRGELYSADRLEQLAESIARFRVSNDERADPAVLPRMRDNGRVLQRCYRALAAVIEEERVTTPAAEWLVDNYYIVEDVLAEVRTDLPPGFYRELPTLVEGPRRGLPRAVGLAWSYVEHTDSRFEAAMLQRFVGAFQRVEPLRISELWAVPIALRLMLLENLRRLAEEIVEGRAARLEADRLADVLLGQGGRPAEPLAFEPLGETPLSRAFAVQLAQRLREQDPSTTPALAWLEERLAASGTSADELVRAEHQRQGAANVTVRNVITSLRVMATFDWRAFFESVSLVDRMLRKESDFGDMDFATRDRYRKAVEELARGSGRTELEVARAALDLTRGERDGRSDPGYYLISEGRSRLEAAVRYRVSLRQHLIRACVASAIWSYVGSITILTGFVLCLPLLYMGEQGAPLAVMVALALFALFPASDLAVALVNRAAVELFPPRPLPRLALPSGVPAPLKTLVAVPTLLTSEAQIEEQIRRLGIHYLANADGALAFAVLSDWTDADAPTMPDDERLLAAARRGIEELNHTHGPADDGEPRFHLFHRRRMWSATQRRWIGWERKRGKIHELNRLLRGATDTTYIATDSAPLRPPANVRYVITLDADTQLPRGAAARMVGTLAHPLNRAQVDPRPRRVTRGYGILQPRIAATMPAERESSLFQRISSGPPGIDPYAAAVSDVYQDVFGEGSYTGKGIYDVDAFEAALADRVPEGALLSHDLFEGLFARAGLATDIELFEEFPARYEVAAAREHRWARGDWQLLPWLLRGGAGRGAARAHFTGIDRWKMIDNLRRSLSAPGAYLTLLLAWWLPGGAATVWTKLVLLSLMLPALVPVTVDVMPKRPGVSKRVYVQSLVGRVAVAAGHAALALTLLAHQAWLMGDAVLRTLVRLVTRRRLLEWVSAAQAKASSSLHLGRVYMRMGGALGLAALAAVAASRAGAEAWLIAFPVIALWLLSPAVAWWISLPPRALPTEALTGQDVAVLRTVARRSWAFFERFVGPEDHWLPPDNFQEDPHPVVAHRTSPTNVGLYLLSATAARDLGWIGALDLTDRLQATLTTMEGLDRFRGHFYNWYDTVTLRPLEPRYVSTVDSGNLEGHLRVVAVALRDAVAAPLVDTAAGRGIDDALLALEEALAREASESAPATRCLDAVARARAVLVSASSSLPAWAAALGTLATEAAGLAELAATLPGDGREDAVAWAAAAQATIASHHRDLEAFAPWAGELAELLAALPDSAARDLVAAQRLLGPVPPTGEVAALALDAAAELTATAGPRADRGRIAKVVAALEASALAVAAATRRRDELAAAVMALAEAMDFTFLFDASRQLFTIGYRVGDGVMDEGRYDLLASEARLTSFLAVARGEVAAEHWFRLGRPMTPVELGTALVSWSGSMFEYLMPALVLRAPEGSLLDQTARLVVKRQIAYGASNGVPWGISESAFNVRDLDLNYQYSAFGVPGLGLQRGLGDDLVIAPYATGLAAMVEPSAAARNFAEIARLGGRGRHGYYEALDFTRSRLPEGARVAIVRTYMAHHQGMTVTALANVLRDGILRARFHGEPMVEATELLLHERAPRDVPVTRPRGEEVRAPGHLRETLSPLARRFSSPADPLPRTHLLSNGRYAVMLTAAGAGYSHCGPIAVTRWREDGTRDGWGSFVFLRDGRSGEVWSAGHQPSGVEAETYQATFLEDRAEIRRRDGTILTTLEVIVSPEDDAEVRRLSVTNVGSEPREIDVTSYAELVLAPPRADAAHPAFSSLFVQTEALPELDTLLATRQPRMPEEEPIWAAHLMVVEGASVGGSQHETDRSRFLGRGRGVRTPMAMIEGRPLSNTAGSVLDPIFSLRRRLLLAPGGSARVVFSTLLATSRAGALLMADKYRDPATFERIATLAWTQAQVQLHHLGIGADEAHLFQALANRILFADARMRAPAAVLARNALGPAALWAHRISGDLPIVLVRIDEVEDRGIVRQLLRAHEYWRMKGLAVDLVILNEKPASYLQDLQGALESLVRAGRPSLGSLRAGGVFVLRGDLLSPAERDCLYTAARVILLSRQGSLAEQVTRAERPAPPRRRERRSSPARPVESDPPPASPPREFDNGLGGFVDEGREYMIALGPGQWTPAPWINVIANERLGFQVSESGAGYTWAVNSRENQLTPWSNDAVSDPPGETIYVRDDETGQLWGPTLLPIREEAWPYQCRHGQGYSRFSHRSHGIELTLTQYVPLHDPVKISRLKLVNHSGRPRRLSVTAYVEWVLGPARADTAAFVVTERCARTGALLARNPWTIDFPGRVAFLDLAGTQTAWTGDRTEIIGRNGTLDHPDALERGLALSGRVGSGLDPCGALQRTLALAPGEEAEVVVFLGQGETLDEAQEIVERTRAADLDAALQAVVTRWDDVLAAVQVKTPDRSLDLMLNRWLLYQALACRVWARAGFYQAGGAYGFRDQLQDVMALTVAARDVTRAQLLRAASRQFVEGDVQHWWHPPSGRGVRTRISDDLLWLPYAAAHYVAVTGDQSVLDAEASFLEGPPLADAQLEHYFEPAVSRERASLFEHAARAIDRSLTVGPHGLPLMGSGDWNDGMNRVGHKGRGESVWLGWFLFAVLGQWAPLAEARGERTRAERWRAHAGALREALEAHGWDGDWYRRAYFDDGTPLGSAENAECRIDSIAQSWAVLSGAADPARAARAMGAVEEYLVHREQALVLLFTPPFVRPRRDPGYIRAYPPGIRENGGQYTHGAIWAIMAYAALGNGDRVGELFSILNPVNHASTRAGLYRYRVEPYVVAADVYAEAPHIGRGGWTWYTGSAGWMYRAGIEWLLGFRLRGAALFIDPCIPRVWSGFSIRFRYHAARYEITVDNPRGVTRGIERVELDGIPVELGPEGLALRDDGAVHRVRVWMG
jgi:cyclic beta-1,2-glucan glucanotransferase